MLGLTDIWMTPQEQYGGIFMFLSVGFSCIRRRRLFTPETLKVFCGLKHTSPPSPVDNELMFIFG